MPTTLMASSFVPFNTRAIPKSPSRMLCLRVRNTWREDKQANSNNDNDEQIKK